MTAENDTQSAISDEFPLPYAEVGSAERAARLRDAVEAAGGNAPVARKIGMPFSTIGRYLAGREMKASAMIALAEATGVRLEWLATGKGPKTNEEAEAQASKPPQPQPSATSALLSDRVDLERLVHAYRAARQVTEDPEQLMQLTLRFHDVLAAQDPSPRDYTTDGGANDRTRVKTP